MEINSLRYSNVQWRCLVEPLCSMEFPFSAFSITFILRLDFRNIRVGHFDHKGETFFS